VTTTITGLSTRRLELPLPRPWGPDVRSVTIVVVEIEASDGLLGRGFAWTPSIGAASVRAMLDHDIRSFVLGRPDDARGLSAELWRHLHEAGGGGVTTIAAAGLDLALWDLAGRRAGVSVVDLVGRRRDSVAVYGSGVNLHYPLDELVAQAERWLARGLPAVKIKVGRPDLAEDLERVAAVRQVIGSGRELMIDANQRWDLPTAVRALDAFAPLDIAWIEEPLRADDLTGYRSLRAETGIPIACGENLYTRHRFAEFIDAGVVDVIQPNVVRVGGISPFLDIVGATVGTAVRVSPHLLPELTGQMAMLLEDETMVEDVEDASFAALGALAAPTPITIRGARAEFTPIPGLGIVFTGATITEDTP
jgi:L-alanine-DL-glutamate epimerase-like enolase superfamily enzyme